MSQVRPVKLQHPQRGLFSNCLLTTPTFRAEYSIVSRHKFALGRLLERLEGTTIYALSPSASKPNTPAIDTEKETSFFDDRSVTRRDVESATSKRVVANINWQYPFKNTDIEIPDRGRGQSAVVGPMRRNMDDLMLKSQLR